MSKFNLIATAVAVALASPAAFAVTITDGGAGTAAKAPTVTVGNIAVKDATTVVQTGDIAVNIESTDLIIGRTTGFSVRIQLPEGTTFGENAPATLTPAGSAVEGWTISKAAGGTTSDSVVVYSVQNNGTAEGVAAGELFKTTFSLKGVQTLKNVGGSVSATVTLADPNTSTQILQPVSAVILRSADPLKYTVGASRTPEKKIDVGSLHADTKTFFSRGGEINAGEGNLEAFFEAGAPTIDVATNVKHDWDLANDTAALTLDGNFSAFTQKGASVALIKGGVDKVCGGALDAAEYLVGKVTASGVTFPAAPVGEVSGGRLCFTVPADNKIAIDQTQIGTSVKVTYDATGESTSGTAQAMAMQYNGPVAYVDHFNPASNAAQQSYLRITNTSGTAGAVNITGVCDNGIGGEAPVTVQLAAQNSIQLNSQDIENGNASKGVVGGLGSCGGGKHRLTITGEFPSMQVQNFLRNSTSSGVINTNVNNRDK